MTSFAAGLAAQPSKKQLPIAFAKVASEAQRATQVQREAEWSLLLIIFLQSLIIFYISSRVVVAPNYHYIIFYKLLTNTIAYKLLFCSTTCTPYFYLPLFI